MAVEALNLPLGVPRAIHIRWEAATSPFLHPVLGTYEVAKDVFI